MKVISIRPLTVPAGTLTSRLRRGVRGGCGFATALILLAVVGEVYLRIAPPTDLVPYIGDAGGVSGPFVADDRYGAAYRNLDALAADNTLRFERYRLLFDPTQSPSRVWAFFGSSFAQAPGMLGDTAAEFVPQRQSFYLGKNELIPIRLTQADMLLNSGLPAERIFLVMIPLDALQFAQHGLHQYRATLQGALAFEPRRGSSSRLALKTLLRFDKQANIPNYDRARLCNDVDPRIVADLRTLFGHFAVTANEHRVPVTLVLLPNYEQVMRGHGFAIQDVYTSIGRELGWSVVDVRDAFLNAPDRAALFIPDRHYSRIGNRLLLATLIDELKRIDPASADLPDAAGVRP